METHGECGGPVGSDPGAGVGGGLGGRALGEADLDRVARLARLRVDPGERADLLRRLGAILDQAAALGSLDLEGVAPLSHPHEDAARLDEDEPRAALDRSALASMAPGWDGRFITVPKVLGGGESGG